MARLKRNKTGAFRRCPADSLKVFQFTDTHLLADPEGRVLGLNPEQTLRAVLDHARQTGGTPDLALATGDLVHDGSDQGYQRLHGILQGLGVPVYALPGNHDESATFGRRFLGDEIRAGKSARYDRWQIVLLDSTIPASDAGHVSAMELETLQSCLEKHPNHYTLICLHHPPVPIGSRWLDVMAVDNPEPFFRLVDRYPNVRGILWGHVHQEFDRMRNQVLLMATPSTCFQFKPHSEGFAVDLKPPGYRWLALCRDGEILTGVDRLAELPAGLDPSSVGY
jgi:Icc protein